MARMARSVKQSGKAGGAAKRLDDVIDWLLDYIARNRIAIGDALPKEIEIAAACAASRSTVREALSALKALGVIRSRRRGGIRLMRSPAIVGLRAYLIGEYADKRRFQEALELRILLEEGLAPLVAGRITPAAVAHLKRIVERVERGEDTDLMEAERAFHALLAQASGNRLAMLLSDIYAPLFRSFPQHSRQPYQPGDVATWVAQHLRVVKPLEQGEPELFVKRMREHIAAYRGWSELEKPSHA
jgi:GntR family transcriptional repressor for pyruvate dehydrogenase complex